MKVASIRRMQHNLGEVLSWVEQGEEVQVLRRKQVVAKLVPPDPVKVRSPDFVGRARAVWGDKPSGPRLSALVDEGRGDP